MILSFRSNYKLLNYLIYFTTIIVSCSKIQTTFQMFRKLSKLVLIFVLAFLTGCLEIPFIKNITQHFQADEPIESGFHKTNIDIKSLRIPQKGERVSIYDPTSDQKIEVNFGHVYTAASGKLCTLYSQETDDGYKVTKGLTCMEQQGEWVNIPLLIHKEP